MQNTGREIRIYSIISAREGTTRSEIAPPEVGNEAGAEDGAGGATGRGRFTISLRVSRISGAPMWYAGIAPEKCPACSQPLIKMRGNGPCTNPAPHCILDTVYGG